MKYHRYRRATTISVYIKTFTIYDTYNTQNEEDTDNKDNYVIIMMKNNNDDNRTLYISNEW